MKLGMSIHILGIVFLHPTLRRSCPPARSVRSDDERLGGGLITPFRRALSQLDHSCKKRGVAEDNLTVDDRGNGQRLVGAGWSIGGNLEPDDISTDPADQVLR